MRTHSKRWAATGFLARHVALRGALELASQRALRCAAVTSPDSLTQGFEPSTAAAAAAAVMAAQNPALRRMCPSWPHRYGCCPVLYRSGQHRHHPCLAAEALAAQRRWPQRLRAR